MEWNDNQTYILKLCGYTNHSKKKIFLLRIIRIWPYVSSCVQTFVSLDCFLEDQKSHSTLSPGWSGSREKYTKSVEPLQYSVGFLYWYFRYVVYLVRECFFEKQPNLHIQAQVWSKRAKSLRMPWGKFLTASWVHHHLYSPGKFGERFAKHSSHRAYYSIYELEIW